MDISSGVTEYLSKVNYAKWNVIECLKYLDRKNYTTFELLMKESLDNEENLIIENFNVRESLMNWKLRNNPPCDDLAYYDVLDLTPGSNSDFVKNYLPTEVYNKLMCEQKPQQKEYNEIKHYINDMIKVSDFKKLVIDHYLPTRDDEEKEFLWIQSFERDNDLLNKALSERMYQEMFLTPLITNLFQKKFKNMEIYFGEKNLFASAEDFDLKKDDKKNRSNGRKIDIVWATKPLKIEFAIAEISGPPNEHQHFHYFTDKIKMAKMLKDQEATSKFKISNITIRENHAIFLTTEGFLYTFENGDNYQLGRKVLKHHNVNGLNPEKLCTKQIRFKKMFSGSCHNFAVDYNGIVVWRLNNYGQCGIESQDSYILLTKVESFRELLEVKQIAGGLHHMLVLQENDYVYSFGHSYYGTLVILPTRIKNFENCNIIVAGDFHSIAIDKEGNLLAYITDLQVVIDHINDPTIHKEDIIEVIKPLLEEANEYYAISQSLLRQVGEIRDQFFDVKEEFQSYINDIEETIHKIEIELKEAEDKKQKADILYTIFKLKLWEGIIVVTGMALAPELLCSQAPIRYIILSF
ncbi:26299_t:CDS:2 [Gigaspora margarita]|uniref:26299_t:CDS:1 n=1 Tax=Gigaspora margarita TaxID=4874 RepID=A0ABN7V4X4_GIGMA|nr:26299_t:CDS:2 [Gigaspora margarita]